MTQEEMQRYEVPLESLWQSTWRYGDGYDTIEAVERSGWRVVSAWGKEGYDLGSWPFVIVFFKRQGERFEIAYYVEGDVTRYSVPTQAERDALVDELAFFHWRAAKAAWVAGYESAWQLPEALRGPYRAA